MVYGEGAIGTSSTHISGRCCAEGMQGSVMIMAREWRGVTVSRMMGWILLFRRGIRNASLWMRGSKSS